MPPSTTHYRPRRGSLLAAFATVLATAALLPEVAAASVTVTPPSLDFGGQTVGTTSAVRDVTVTNTGTCPILVGVNVNNPQNAGDFAVSTDAQQSDQLASGASRTYHVTFRPDGTGSHMGELIVYVYETCPASGAQPEGTVSLCGNGVAAETVTAPTTTTATAPPGPTGGTDTSTPTGATGTPPVIGPPQGTQLQSPGDQGKNVAVQKKPRRPKKCKCLSLDSYVAISEGFSLLKFQPDGLGHMRFHLRWVIKCTHGAGGCNGTVTLGAPAGQGVTLEAAPVVINCAAACAATQTGDTVVNLTMDKSWGNTGEPRKVTLTVEETCGKGVHEKEIVLAFTKHGFLDKKHSTFHPV